MKHHARPAAGPDKDAAPDGRTPRGKAPYRKPEVLASYGREELEAAGLQHEVFVVCPTEAEVERLADPVQEQEPFDNVRRGSSRLSN